MLKHPDIWRAIDELAEQHGFSPSGLAREAGLDATTFNVSKRTTEDGKKRWPSTESVGKILDVTGTGFMEFAALVERTAFKNKIPVLPLAAAARTGHFDADGKPAGKAWGRNTIAGVDDDNAFGISVSGKSLEPAYRDGALLVACPAARIGKGDRVAVVTADGALSIRGVTKVAGKTYELLLMAARENRGAKLTATQSQLRLIAKITLVIE